MGESALPEHLQPEEFQYDSDFFHNLFLNPDPNRTGDWGELHVCALAIKKGAIVYKNSGKTGDTDIHIKYGDIEFNIDVKVSSRKYSSTKKGLATGWRNQNRKPAPKGVYYVSVIPAKTGIVVRWFRDGKANLELLCPEGLETFWD